MNRSPLTFWSSWLLHVAVLIGFAFVFHGSNLWSQDRGGSTDELDEGIQQIDREQDVERILQETFIQAEQSVFVSAPREFLRPLIRANRAIAENDPARAVSLLGEVLSDSTNEDFLVPVLGTEGASVSLRLRAQLILGSLPAKDRELYRLRYGVQAKQLLEKAVDQRDFELVSQVMQRFFYTRAGFDAAMLLGHHHLDQGRPVAAASCFQRVADSEEAREIHDPEASVLLAMCWMMGDAPDRATQALEYLRTNSRKNTIQFQGQPVRLFDKTDDATEWLRNLIGDSPLRSIEYVNQWLMAGGNPQRNARNGMGVPLINPRWETPTLNDPDIEKIAREYLRDLVFLDSAPIPAVQPLAVGNTIVMRAFDRMIGVDFETGKRVWVFPAWDFAANFSDPKERLKVRTVSKLPLAERLWLDAVYGQASSDGKSIFVVPDPGFSRAAGVGIPKDSEPVVTRLFNELMAVDIAREGAFKWEIGGETGLDEPKLAKAFFLGPPLPLGNELFAVCQQEKIILLVALEADTGRLKWQQTLGTSENNGVQLADDRFRRLAGVSPSFANGVLVCATGNGALVAVDLSSRSLLWGYQYTTPGRRPVQRVSPMKTSNGDPFGGIWRDSSIVIADGKVLFTPVESQDLICVDLRSGFPAWRRGSDVTAKYPRFDSLFIACVENGNVILVGETSVRSVGLNTGKLVWEMSLEEYGKPSGRGYANQGCYYFPMTSERLLQIDLASGKIVKAIRTDGVLGNLICYQGDVVSHGVDRVAAFPQDEPNRRLVAAAEAIGQMTPDLWATKSQLQIQDGNLQAAVESIQLAYEQQPNRAYENILLDLVIRLVEEDFDVGIKLADQYREPLLANRRFEFLAANVNGMIRNKSFDLALDALLELLHPVNQLAILRENSIPISVNKYDGFSNSDSPVHPENEIAISDKTTRVRFRKFDTGRERIDIRLDQWIVSRIKLLHEVGAPDQRAKIEAAIAEIVESVGGLGLGPVELYDTLRMFPSEFVPASIQLQLARQLVNEGESLRATHVLEELRSEAGSPLAAPAIAMNVELLLNRQSNVQAFALLDRLENELGNVAVDQKQTGKQFGRSLRQGAGFPTEFSDVELKWNRGPVNTTTEKTNSPLGLIPCRVKLEDYDSAEYKKFQFRFYGQTGELEILNANGDTAYRFFARQKSQSRTTAYNTYVFGRISIRNSLAIMDIATEIIVFDWLKLKNGEDPVLWNTSISGGARDQTIRTVSRRWGEVLTTTASRGYENRVYVGAPGFEGICYLDNTQLVCLDPLTGNRVWQRSGILPDSILFGDHKNVVVWNAKHRLVRIFETATGRLTKTGTLGAEIGAIWTSRGCRILVSTDLEREPEPKNESSPLESEESKVVSRIRIAPMDRMLGLYDLLTGEFVWQSEFPAKTRGCLIERDRIAILRPKDDLEIINLQTGELEFKSEIGLDPINRHRITGIGVSVIGDRYLVHLKKGETANRVDVGNMEIKYLNYSDIMWVGHLMCIDSTSGKNSWKNPVRFDNFQLVQGQPANAPVYLLSRRIEKEDEVGARIETINFVGVDLENGNLRFNNLSEYNYRVITSVTCDPKTQKLKIEYYGNLLTFEFTSPTDIPPSPVAHLTNYNSIPNVVRARKTAKFDKLKLDLEKAKSLKRAIEAEKLLPQKRVEEKKQLEREKLTPPGK